jgi:hypothetical protein
MLRNILITTLLFLIVSCQSKVGNKSTINLYRDNIIKGSNLEQITQIYGDYSNNWKDEYGNNIYQYSYSRSKYDLVSQLPIINHFGWIKSENYEVLLIVDGQNQLIGEAKFYNQAKSRNSLVCNPEIYSCLRKIY